MPRSGRACEDIFWRFPLKLTATIGFSGERLLLGNKDSKYIANEIQVLKQTELLGQQFAVYGTPEEPLFLAKDVATWIEHTDVSKMVQSVDDDEKLTRTLFVSGQNREVWMLTENGLYELLMLSRKPIAKEFKN